MMAVKKTTEKIKESAEGLIVELNEYLGLEDSESIAQPTADRLDSELRNYYMQTVSVLGYLQADKVIEDSKSA